MAAISTPNPPLEHERSPIFELLFLAGPTVAQMASYTLMQFFDTWMLSHAGIGIDAPTAASQSGMLAFSVISLGMGVLWVVNTLVSQSFGRKDYVDCGRYLWQGVWFALAFGLLLLPALPFVSSVFAIMGHQPALALLETQYMRIVIGGSIFKLVTTAFSQFLLAIDRTPSVLAATVFGVSCNVVAAWSMIFGHLGFHKMGVAGSAWGQNVGTFCEMAAVIALALRLQIRRFYNLRDWKPRGAMLLTLLRIGIPSGVQIVADVLAWSLFTMWVMAVFGDATMAANTYVFRYMSVSFMPAFGISSAVTALVGRYLGADRPDIARKRADLAFSLTAAYMLSCGLLFFLGRRQLIAVFSTDPQVLQIGARIMIFAAVYQLFDAMYIVYNGALRGAGDTFVPALLTACLCWGLTVFGGYAVAHMFFRWGANGPWSVATLYGIVLGIIMLMRFRRGEWRAIPKAV